MTFLFLILKNALLISSLLIMVQCGSSQSEENQNNKRLGFGPASFDIGECDKSPLEGRDFNPLAFQSQPQLTTYFNKVLMIRAFEEALPSNSYSIVEALYNQGLDIYHVPPFIESKCHYYDFVFEAPELYQQQWSTSNLKTTGPGRLLGLFTTYFEKSPSTLQVNLLRPTILLMEDTEKWTLVHEMTHYLFTRNRASQMDMPFHGDLEAKARKAKLMALKAKNSLSANSTAKEAHQVIDHYKEFWDTNLELDARSALEEFTIESMLAEKVISNQLQGVNNFKNLTQAYSYMKFNKEEVSPSYRKFLKELQELNLTQWKAANRKLRNLKKEVRETIQFIEDKLNLVTPLHRPLFDLGDSKLSKETMAPELFHHYDLEKLRKRHELFDQW